MIKLQFAVYTDITALAKKTSSEYNMYSKILVCPDTNTTWIARIQENINDEYETEEGVVLIERNNLDDFGSKGNNSFEKSSPDVFVKNILEADMDAGFENWDNLQVSDLDEAMSELSDIFGIIQEDGSIQKW